MFAGFGFIFNGKSGFHLVFFIEPKAIYVHKVVRAADIKIYIKVAELFSIIFSWNPRGIRQIPS